MWSALENIALRENLPAPLDSGQSIHDILVTEQLDMGKYHLHYMGQRRSKQYLLKQYYSLNMDAFLRWQNEARFTALERMDGFHWPTEEWRGGVISPLPRGTTLANWLAEAHPSIDARLDMAGKIAGLIARLHTSGIAHRRLTPDSIYIHKNVPVISDFGHAHHNTWDDFWVDDWLTPKDMAYVSPEILQGKEAGYSADVYAFGALLQWMLAGKPPFGSIKQALRGLFPSLISPGSLSHTDDVPPEISLLVRSCLALDHEDRPSIRQIAHGFDENTSLSTITQAMPQAPSGKQRKIMLFIKDDRRASSLFDAILNRPDRESCAFLFVGLIPNHLPSGHTQSFTGRLFRGLSQGLSRCREAGVVWGLRVFENTDPEQGAVDLVRQYQPDQVYIGKSAQKRPLFQQGFHAGLAMESVPVEKV